MWQKSVTQVWRGVCHTPLPTNRWLALSEDTNYSYPVPVNIGSRIEEEAKKEENEEKATRQHR